MEHVCMLPTVIATPYPNERMYLTGDILNSSLTFTHGTTNITICRKQNLKFTTQL